MSDLLTAAGKLRTLLAACKTGDVDARMDAVPVLIHAVARTDVIEALERLLGRIHRFVEVNETIPLGAAFRVADMIHAAHALAAAINHTGKD